MFKNVASQKLIVFAFDSTTNLPKTGDSANITAYVSKDYGSVTVLGDTSATEMDATNAKGYYLFDLTQGETNGDTLLFSAKSTTSNIVVVGAPATVFTDPASYTSFVTPTNLTAAQIATGVWQDTTAGDFTAANSIGKSVMNGVALGTGLTINAYTGNTVQTGDAYGRIGANGVSLSAIPDLAGVTTLLSRLSALRAGYLDNLSAGAVALASGVTVSDKTGFSLVAGYDPAKTAAQAGDAMTLTAAYNFAKGTTAVTESYAANGAAPTPVQAIMAIHQMLMQFSITSTTYTVRKLDNSTTAFTVTLDSASSPTSAVRT